MSKKTMMPELVGKKDFNGSVDITDPCYSKDVWCRINDVKIKDGVYYCYVWRNKEEKRVSRIGIYLNGEIPKQTSMKLIGEIGVDAGLAGFFHEKQDFNDEEWSRFCENCISEDCMLNEYGFYSSSGYGDGCYPVYAYEKQHEKVALEIAFM